MTPTDLIAFVEGHNAAHRSGPEPMTRARYEELKAQYPDD